MHQFRELSTERPLGYGVVGPIPSSRIKDVALSYGDEADAFTSCMRAMDNAFLNAVCPPKKGEHRVMKTPLKPGGLREIFD